MSDMVNQDVRTAASAKGKKTEIPRCKCSNNYSWIFWIILLVMVGYFIYWVITTIQGIIDNPEEFFPEGGEIIRAIVGL